MSDRDDLLYSYLVKQKDNNGDFSFLRRDSVDVMRYLPHFIGHDEGFLDLQNALSREHEESLRLKLQDIARQFYIETATWGLDTWERVYEVTPPLGADYQIRRAIVKAKMLGLDVMTVQQIKRLVNGFLVVPDADIEELPSPGTFNVLIHSGTDYMDGIRRALAEMSPAHLVYNFRFVIEDLLDNEGLNLGDDFDVGIVLPFHDLIPYGTNTIPIFHHDGTYVHGHPARRNGHFLHGGRGLDKIYPRIVIPYHQGREDISNDYLDYWPVWIGRDSVPVKETLPDDLGMSLAISEDIGQPVDKLALPLSMEFHDAYPYGTEREVFSHDGILRHGFSFKRRGLFLHGGRGRHGWPPMGLKAHGCKYDLDHDRLSVYAIGCSFKDEVKPKESEHNDIALQVSSDRVPAPREGDMPLEAGLILHHDNSVRHNGRYVRGVNPCRAGDFEIIRERRDGRFARGGRVRHRDSPVAAFA